MSCPMPNLNPERVGATIFAVIVLAVITVSVIGGLHVLFERDSLLATGAGIISILFGFLCAASLGHQFTGEDD